MKKRNKILNMIKKHDILSLGIITFIFEFIIYLLKLYNSSFMYIFVLLLIISIIFLFFDKKNMKKNIFYLIYIIGVLIRTIYILNTSVYVRGHDVGVIGGLGHLAYIFNLFTTGKLPINIAGQFYHPPFWHILASLWLSFNKLFNMDIILSIEGIQILTLVLSSLTIVITNKICEKLKLKDLYRYLTISFMVVHPTMIILSGSINNDMLMIFLEFFIILKLIDWYNEPNFKNTICLGIVTGLCVMTKSNGAIMAIPILYVFIKKIWENHHEKIKITDYIKKILLFGIISLPIGLWFQVRSLILFHGYNPVLDLREYLYVGNHSIFSRFFTINFSELFDIPRVASDYNLPSYIIKSSLFGEFQFDNIGILRILLTSVCLLLIIIFIIFTIRYLFKNKKNIIINILLITYITSLISMYIFNYIYPNGCSMDFRYIVITLLSSITLITYSLNDIKNKYIKIPIIIIISLFIMLSLIFIFLI